MTTQLVLNEVSFAEYHSAVVHQQKVTNPYLAMIAMAEALNTPTWQPVNHTKVPKLEKSSGTKIDAMPAGVAAHWSRLSQLPEAAFNGLLSAATSPSRVTGKSSPVSAKSLGVFLDLWEMAKAFAAEPVMSVTPKGCVVAEWVRDETNLLAIMTTHDELTYILFEDGVPLEASIPTGDLANFVQQMRVRGANPFLWSDA